MELYTEVCTAVLCQVVLVACSDYNCLLQLPLLSVLCHQGQSARRNLITTNQSLLVTATTLIVSSVFV